MQVLAQKPFVEGMRKRQLLAIITIIDFRKAFDSIHSGKLVGTLEAYGTPKPIVATFSSTHPMNANTSAKVLSPDGVIELFPILAGMLKGHTLAPY